MWAALWLPYMYGWQNATRSGNAVIAGMSVHLRSTSKIHSSLDYASMYTCMLLLATDRQKYVKFSYYLEMSPFTTIMGNSCWSNVSGDSFLIPHPLSLLSVLCVCPSFLLSCFSCGPVFPFLLLFGLSFAPCSIPFRPQIPIYCCLILSPSWPVSSSLCSHQLIRLTT